MPVKLFGVNLPEINKKTLAEEISGINKHSKKTLYFLYSEFLLRANRNPFYRLVLNRANISAIDGRGLHWAQYRLAFKGSIPNLYEKVASELPTIIRLILFVILFFCECLVTILSGLFNLILRLNFGEKINNQVVLGREFVYNLLEIAEKKKWKTLIVGGNSDNSQVVQDKILELYPSLKLDIWSEDYHSNLMRDEAEEEFVSQTDKNGFVLNSDNLFQAFPALKKARDYIKKKKPDLIIVCLGGQSGKQEFFIDNLQADPAVSFTLATGVGAALDHLGTGAKQEKPPQWMTENGLEWVFRFIKQPYRRLRICDSIFTLWWWTTLEQFTLNLRFRKTIVNIIFREIQDLEGEEYLLLRRKTILPGDVAWSFVQGGVNNDEVLELAGLREVREEVDLNNWDFKILRQAQFANYELYPTSFLRFVLLGGLYKGSKNYTNLMEYTGSKLAKVNWENLEARWIEESQVEKYLSAEKAVIWEKYKIQD